MEENSSLANLPSEIIINIFKHLGHKDLNNVARVSQRMFFLATDPFLWKDFNLKVKFKKIESHRVLYIAQTLAKVIKIERLRYLNHIDLCDNDLSSLNSEVLSKIVNIVEDCDIGYTDLTNEQVDHIFKIMHIKTRLKKLNIRGNSLRTIQSKILSSTLNKLEDVNLMSTNLTKNQAMDFFEEMSSQSNLKVLNISGNALISVQAASFGTAVNKLEHVKLENTYLRKLQAESLFDSMFKGTKMVTMNINQNVLSSIPQEKVAFVINRLKEVDFSQTKLVAPQTKEIFEKMSELTSLQKLKINEVDLSAVPANTLSKAVNKIEEVELSKTSLTIYQGIYIFSIMSEETKIFKLKIDNNDLSMAPADFLSKGANKLSEVDLCSTKLTDVQITAIFLEMLEDNSAIQKIAMDGNIESRYKEFVKLLKDKVNVIVTFDRSHEITTIHLFKKF